jgi:hypothetical protein
VGKVISRAWANVTAGEAGEEVAVAAGAGDADDEGRTEGLGTVGEPSAEAMAMGGLGTSAGPQATLAAIVAIVTRATRARRPIRTLN